VFEQIFRVLATRTTKERVENETQVRTIMETGSVGQIGFADQHRRSSRFPLSGE
jgi:hypothetical protein